jgi:peptidoglycan/xylan/chitin deacetylase (PgdA/CDA1 family)
MSGRIKQYIKIVISIFLVGLFWFSLLAGPLSLQSLKNNTQQVPQVVVYSSNISDNYPKEKTVVLRLDDVQGYTWNRIVINLTEAVLSRNMSITLGVIPNGEIDKDKIIKQYLLSKIDDPRVEIAQHGTYHKENEFANLSEEEAYDLAKVGFDELVNILRVRPVTFIPPGNANNQNTTKALSRLGLKILPGKQDVYKFDGQMMLIGYNAETEEYLKSDLVPVSEILDACKKSLENRNLCVIMIHPQDYVLSNDRNTLDENKYKEFIKLLDELKKLNVKFSAFKDL